MGLTFASGKLTSSLRERCDLPRATTGRPYNIGAVRDLCQRTDLVDNNTQVWKFFCFFSFKKSKFFQEKKRKRNTKKAPSGRELAPKAAEGERVTMKLSWTQSHAGSFHHFVVPLPLGGRLFCRFLTLHPCYFEFDPNFALCILHLRHFAFCIYVILHLRPCWRAMKCVV